MNYSRIMFSPHFSLCNNPTIFYQSSLIQEGKLASQFSSRDVFILITNLTPTHSQRHLTGHRSLFHVTTELYDHPFMSVW